MENKEGIGAILTWQVRLTYPVHCANLLGILYKLGDMKARISFNLQMEETEIVMDYAKGYITSD